ncbi:UNVERIFIED_ORG: hypothetical protein J2W87_001681 [Pseudomonas putida]|nr:hypothetical protein [Pseudomonas putida]
MTSLPTDRSSLSSDPAIEDLDLLTIRQVLDPNGTSIVGTITYATSFKVIGNGAEPDKVVWIMNGAEKLGEATSNGSGEWQTPLLPVTKFDCFSIVARGKYGSEPVSIPPKKFTVATETPMITAVLGEAGPILDNGETYETSVTFQVDAVPNERARAFDGETELDSGLASGCGKLSIKLIDLEAKKYIIKIKSSAGKESSPFTFTVKAATPLTIDEVTDDEGKPVDDGESTIRRVITVKGGALANGNLSLTGGRPTPVAVKADDKGEWSHTFTALPDGEYKLNVEASYNDDVAGPRTFIVRKAVAATLETVTDKKGDLVDRDDVTFETELDVEGQGEENQSIEIYDGTESLGVATVTSGHYKLPIGPLAEKGYSLVAKAKYPDGGESAPYLFTVEANHQAPKNTRVHNPDGTVITDGGNTFSRHVYVRGETRSLASVKIKINGVTDPDPEDSNVQGKWVRLVSQLEVGTTHVVSAVDADNPDAESNTWTITVVAEPQQ